MLRAVFTACVLTVAALAPTAHAAVSYTTPASTYSQSFDTLDNDGTTNDETWTNDSTLVGWHLFNAAGTAMTTYRSDDGGSATGNFYSYGTDGQTDRALGAIGSGAYFGSPATGAVAGYIALQITNNTGGDLVSFTLNYDGEQWRDDNTVAQTMTAEYGFGATFGSVGSWTALGSGFNFTSPQIGDVNQINGNLAANRVDNLGGTISSLTWANGVSLWVRFIDVNNTGTDHALAIDDFSFSAEAAASPIPSPAALPAAIALAGVLASRRRRR